MLSKLVEQPERRRPSDTKVVLNESTCEHGDLEQNLDERLRVEILGYLLPESLPQVNQQSGAANAIIGLAGYRLAEEPDPRIGVAGLVNPLQMLDVLVSTLLEVRADVQHRSGEPPSRNEEHRNEQSTSATVSIEKWMDGLELVVHQSALREYGHPRRCFVDEPLPIIECDVHLVGRRWNVCGGFECGQWTTDPILRSTDLTRRLIAPPDAIEQNRVRFANQPHRHRQGSKTGDRVFGGTNVVDHLLHIGRQITTRRLAIVDIRHRGASALDARRRDRLANEVRPNE